MASSERISEMRNLGPVTEEDLLFVGVTSPQQVIELGVEGTFVSSTIIRIGLRTGYIPPSVIDFLRSKPANKVVLKRVLDTNGSEQIAPRVSSLHQTPGQLKYVCAAASLLPPPLQTARKFQAQE